MSKPNRVTLNLPKTPQGARPDPDKPLVSIDGVAVEHFVGVSVICHAEEPFTLVSITFAAVVEGVIEVEEKILPSPSF